MATSKKNAESIEKVTSAAENADKKTVTIRIPRDRNDAEDKVVWVNEVRYLIQKGVPVEVPVAVAEILEQEEEMLNYIYDFENKVQR